MIAIEVTDLWKRYYLHDDKPTTLKEAVLNRFHHTRARDEFWALQGISLQIPQGHTVGIIGNNGAGKSTLLRLLSGLGRPTRGHVHYHGRISTLLELGTGFQPDFSGRDNVYTSAIVSGLTRREVTERFDEIVDFAELHDFIDAPVRTYSSGMYVRLAFATAISLDPDIVVVDEVLAVGDLRFQDKCLRKLQSMKQAGKTVVLVSHVMGQIETLCDAAIWIEAGKVRSQGQAADVVEQYRNRLALPPRESSSTEFAHPVASPGSATSPTNASGPQREHRTGSQDCQLTSVRILDERGVERHEIRSGDAVTVEVAYSAAQPLTRPIFSVAIIRSGGVMCYEAQTEADNLFLERVHGDGRITLSFPELNLMAGSYYIDVGVYAVDWQRSYDYVHQASSFDVGGHTPGTGIFYAPHRWSAS